MLDSRQRELTVYGYTLLLDRLWGIKRLLKLTESIPAALSMSVAELEEQERHYYHQLSLTICSDSGELRRICNNWHQAIIIRKKALEDSGKVQESCPRPLANTDMEAAFQKARQHKQK
jgi:hypothetical protein